MRAELILCFIKAESELEIWPVTLDAVRSKAVVLLLFNHYLFLLPLFVEEGLYLSPCCVVQYFASFLVLQSSYGGKKSWLLYFCGILNVMFLLMFFSYFSRCLGLVCSM